MCNMANQVMNKVQCLTVVSIRTKPSDAHSLVTKFVVLSLLAVLTLLALLFLTDKHAALSKLIPDWSTVLYKNSPYKITPKHIKTL